MASEAIEDYVKVIYELSEAGDRATTTALARRLAVAPASVTNMLERLRAMSLVDYRPYRGAQLTEQGRTLALETLRHHRLLETYLQRVLGFSWDEVHCEAERLEHAISEHLEEHLAAALEDPAFDPHGDPIPTRAGELPELPTVPLATVGEGSRVQVRRVANQQPAVLRYLASLGIRPGMQLDVVGRAPFEGPLTLKVGRRTEALAHDLASSIYVTLENEDR